MFVLNCAAWNCTFTYQLFIDQLKVSGEFEPGDLDLQGQFCHEISNVCVNPCECDNF